MCLPWKANDFEGSISFEMWLKLDEGGGGGGVESGGNGILRALERN